MSDLKSGGVLPTIIVALLVGGGAGGGSGYLTKAETEITMSEVRRTVEHRVAPVLTAQSTMASAIVKQGRELARREETIQRARKSNDAVIDINRRLTQIEGDVDRLQEKMDAVVSGQAKILGEMQRMQR